MEKLQVEEAIEIPKAARRGRAGESRYPKLEIGQSVWMRLTGRKPMNVASAMMHGLKVQQPGKYVSRAMVKDGIHGVRVWRIK